MSELKAVRARTQVYLLTVTQLDPATGMTGPVDLDGKTLRFTASRYFGKDPVIAKYSPDGGIVIGTPTSAGLATMTINPADTQVLPDIDVNTLDWDAVLVDGSNEYPLDGGELSIYGNVTP